MPWLSLLQFQFKYSACRFKVQKKKEGTGRIVMWQQMGILNSFTMEATFAGITKYGIVYIPYMA